MKLPRSRDFRYIGAWTSPNKRITISGGISGGSGKYLVYDNVQMRGYRCRTFAEVREVVREIVNFKEEG